MEQERENLKKERRKNLWKRLGFKLRIFNIFANKISQDQDPTAERLIKLKRKLGKTLINSLFLYKNFTRDKINFQEHFSFNNNKFWIKGNSNQNKKRCLQFSQEFSKLIYIAVLHIVIMKKLFRGPNY